MSSNKIPTMMIECAVKGNSGWVLGDIEKDPSLRFTGKKRTSPGRFVIPNTGYMMETVTEANGSAVKKNVRLRYIKHCPYIRVDEQEKNGFVPHKDKEQDLIVMYEGSSIVAREGDIALYDYIEKVNYNGSNTSRNPKAGILFYVVNLDKRREIINDSNFIQTRAIMVVEALVKREGAKEKGFTYKYNELKIDGLCQLLHVWGESYAEKIQALTAKAYDNPTEFLKKTTAFEETTLTDVSHALQLGVIKFEGKSVIATEGKKVLATLPANTKETNKEMVFADMLRTNEYFETYNLMKALTDAAKEKEFA